MSSILNNALSSDAAHAAGLPSAEELANSLKFREVLAALEAVPDEVRSRRWGSRLGALLRYVRSSTNVCLETLAQDLKLPAVTLEQLEYSIPMRSKVSVELVRQYAEALRYDVEISFRSRETGQIIGHISTADL